MHLQELIDFLEYYGRGRMTRIGICNPHSYRGGYSSLAFEPTTQPSFVGHWLDVVKPCLGQTFQGYKGGDYLMRPYTDCWFAYQGLSDGETIGPMLMFFIVSDFQTWFNAH